MVNMNNNIEKCLDDITNYIINSYEYKKCIELKKIINNDNNISNLLKKLKKSNNKDEIIKELKKYDIYNEYNKYLDIINSKIDYLKYELDNYFNNICN